MVILQDLLRAAKDEHDRSLKRLFELMEIPSISTQRVHDEDCDQAADWLVNQLSAIGFTARREPTEAHDIVLAHYEPEDVDAKLKPTIIFYGHYDVQPPDPLELWDSDPFTPALKTDKRGETVIHGRGASDDKGQLMTFVEALRLFKTVTGDLPCPVTVMLEGDEESLSPGIGDFLQKHKDALQGACVFVCDTDLYEPGKPAIAASLRGCLYEEVTVHAANRDLHSGSYGGSAQNALNVLVQVLGGFRRADGAITLDGFYDNIEMPEPEILKQWQGLGFDEAALLEDIGLSEPSGEKGFSVLERLWARPTMDINGLKGGYTDEGAKTVIGNEAVAKVSFRLVPGQDPLAIQKAFRDTVSASLPADCRATFKNFGCDPAVRVRTDNPFMAIALQAAEDEWGARPVITGLGGSIPIVEKFKRILGIESILLGFALRDDQIHSPNEKYDVNSFSKGIATWVRVLHLIAKCA